MTIITINDIREYIWNIYAERALVDANRKLIEIFEGKIKAKLREIWGSNKT